jgi:hypothetical protein
MLTIIFLLYFWETAVATARAKTPKTLLLVIESMLAEIEGLGFGSGNVARLDWWGDLKGK